MYTVNFGDKVGKVTSIENITRAGPDQPDFIVFTYTYALPGFYTPTLRVENVFGALQVNLSQRVVVQNPLSGGRYSLVAGEVSTVAIPPGVVVLDARLENFENSGSTVNVDGWANDVHIAWIHVNRQKLLREDNAEFETGKEVKFEIPYILCLHLNMLFGHLECCTF